VRCLRRDVHDEQPTCWLHGSSFCLSRAEQSAANRFRQST
jgi:hypothetical protein